MAKIRFAMIGGGWRSEFSIRIARALPELFEITALQEANEELAKKAAAKYGLKTVWKLEDLLKDQPDFILVALPWAVQYEYSLKLCEVGIPFMCETPPAPDIEKLNELWETVCKYNAKMGVCEQYPSQPFHHAISQIIDSGILGDIINVNSKLCHGYHNVALFRRFLGIGMENVTITGKQITLPTVAHCSRQGMFRDGKLEKPARNLSLYEFENGKTATVDFCDDQYFSYIRKNSLVVQGTMGEINDYTVSFLNADRDPMSIDMKRLDTGHDLNLEGYFFHGITFGDKFVFRNEFAPARLSDDEIAVARMLQGMYNYAKGGRPQYELRDALQDAYLSFVEMEAIRSGKPVTSTKQSWCD